MLIAILSNPIQVGDYRNLFPNTSFPADGPSNFFLEQNNAKKVNVFKSYNQDTEKLVACEPYVEGDWVYTVDVEPLTQEEIDARNASKAAQNKTQAERLLQETDWTQMPDVDLLNKQEFTDYRAAVRAIALNPPVVVEEWPVKPEEQWA